VVLLRTGATMHLDKYKDLPPEASWPGQPPAAEELGAVGQVVGGLPPVGKYRVVGAAYCK
jgi:hypothetical protein